MKNEKKPIARYLLNISFFMSLVMLFVISVSSPAYAAHTSSVTLSPSLTYCGASETFSVEVTHDTGADNIKEVRIYNNYNNAWSSFDCGNPPADWTLTDQTGLYGYCQYQTNSDFILLGGSRTFTFDATIDTESQYQWKIMTLDTKEPQGDAYYNYPLMTVDCTKPVTAKTYKGPQKNLEGVEWISSQTSIILSAYDPDPHPSDVDETYYRNTIVNDYACLNYYYPGDIGIEFLPQPCAYAEGSGDFLLYEGPFNKPDESCHLIEYYSVDNVGNEENLKKQCVFVDNTPPITTKQVGDPKMLCDVEEGCEYWIGGNTEITLSCTDPEPHPVDQVTIWWRYSLDGGQPTPWKEYTGPITFPEESMHTLEYYCVDHLGNEEEHHFQTYKVDATQPTITKQVIGPQVGQCPPQNKGDKCYVQDGTTEIIINAEDTGEHQSNDVQCEWWYTVDENGGDGSDGWVTPPIKIIFPEDSTRELHVNCRDDLGNTAHEVETFYVDSLPPETTKKYGSPAVGPQLYYLNDEISVLADYISVETQITLTPRDEKVGVKDTFYIIKEPCQWKDYPEEECDQVEWVGDYDKNIYHDYNECLENNHENNHDGACIPTWWNVKRELTDGWTVYSDPFVIPQESVHKICFYSVDKLGNTEQIKCQVALVDDTPPELIKRVGKPNVLVNPACDPEVQSCDYFITQGTPIYLSCNDPGPHPVDSETLFWRDYIEGTQPPAYTEEESGEATVYKKEDSRHILEAYCADALDNIGKVDREVFIVDTQAPVITKTIEGPQWGNCPPENLDNIQNGNGNGDYEKCYIDGATTIHVEAVDQTPHPVGDVKCNWGYKISPYDEWAGGAKDVTPPFDIQFKEESEHTLFIKCRDALGNVASEVEKFTVDKTPPVTTKTYEGPQKNLEGVEWISSQTNIIFSAYDPQPHPSGVDKTYYRISLVDDTYCDGINEEEQDNLDCDDALAPPITSDSFFDVFTELSPPKIPQQSCHLIEYYSVDNVKKKEETKRQCAFVDNTPPLPDKTIGKPAETWDGKDAKFYDIGDRCWKNGEGSIECWKVTMQTPITLSCTDPQPHPVDHETIAFMVGLDGKDATKKYCDEVNGEINEDGFCVVDQEAPIMLFFNEESEHNLQFYCTDALGNKGPIDEEKFKVEGTAFKIKIREKWNLISVPFPLLDSNVENVFKDVKDDIDSVWAYYNGQWYVWTPGSAPDTLYDIIPGYGYWVLAKDNANLVVGGSLFSPVTTPPSRDVSKGWNLVGYYGVDWQEYEVDPECNDEEMYYSSKSYCALGSLVDTQQGYPRWSSIWRYVNCGDGDPYWKAIETCATEDYDYLLFAGKGYWLEMDVSDIYAPATTCIWNEENQCIYQWNLP